MVRLQKFLADAGVASRRASERIILEGRVAVNGEIIRQLGTKIDPGHDRISVDGKLVKTKRKLYVALNKPKGIVCSRKDEAGRETVLDLLPGEWSHLFPVGRLDRDSEGLLFLTNDGDFCLQLTHPRYQIPKTYIATIEGRVEPELLEKFLRGVIDHGEKLTAQKARLISANNTRSVVELELTEGKNREVRRLFESQDRMVLALKRIRIGSIKLGELPAGKWRALTMPEIKSLLAKL